MLHTLSRSWGRRSFLIRVSAKSGMSFFLPLNILEVSVSKNPKSDLWYIKSPSSKYPLYGLRTNIHKNTITLFVAEVLFRTLRDGAVEDGLFDWCEKQIITLDSMPEGYGNFHLNFLLGLCGMLGFRPEPEDIRPFSGPYQDVMETLINKDFTSAMAVPLSGAERNDIASCLIRYLEFHTESNINIKSLAVLREIYE